MKRKLIFNILIVLSAAGGFLSCYDTWLMYDTSQKNKLYFSDGAQSLDRYLSTEAPFALLDESVKELRQTVPVKLLGMVADHDRTFEVQAIHDTTTNYTTGGVARELYDAVEGEDYTIDKLIIPAGSVEGRIEVTVKRTEKLKDKTASLVLQIAESDEFQGVPRNVYRILISDGIAACPNWWYHTATIQWYMYLGEFREEKYRKLLELYHGIEELNPSLYAEMVEQFGENIDNKTYINKNGVVTEIRTGFFHSSSNPYKMAWNRYVLSPLYEYYKTNYPDLETYGTYNGTLGTGWRDPANIY